MRFEFLGTAAAEAFPDPFCNCENCEQARKSGGKSFRKRASAIINDELLIDLGPDIHIAAIERGKPFTHVRYALQTHQHNDHAAPQTLFMRSQRCLPVGIALMEYALSRPALEEWNRVTFGGTRSLAEPELQAEHHIKLRLISPGDSFEMGPYYVQSVSANHGEPEIEAMLFAIRDMASGKSVFYGTDTGSLDPVTWQNLVDQGWKFDLLIMDHTRGYRPDLARHLGETGFQQEMRAAKVAGAIDDDTRVIATHFAHHSHAAHEELALRCAEFGYEPAYDGMVIDLATEA